MGNFLAGAVGFEPTNAGSKSRCLTEMRKKNVGIAWFIFFRLKKMYFQSCPMVAQIDMDIFQNKLYT